jgi:Phage Mu protein F like protein
MSNLIRLKARKRSSDPPPTPEHYQQGMRAFMDAVPLTQADLTALEADEVAFAEKVAVTAQANMVNGIWGQLETALAGGVEFAAILPQLAESLDVNWGDDGSALDTLVNTNLFGSYSEGRYEQRTEPTIMEARPYNRYVAQADADEECSVYHNYVAPADDGFWDVHFPPLHHNCKCEIEALSDEEAAQYEERNAPSGEHVDEGFGSPDSSAEWGPDIGQYPGAIAALLMAKLK